MNAFTYTSFLALLCIIACSCSTENINEYGLIENAEAQLLDNAQLRLKEHALDGLEVAPGLEVALFASEPMLINPTNIAVDAKGRIWVCEGINYRPHLNPQNPERVEPERIVILEDTDGDARADKRTVFYEGTDINAALGIWVMGNQAIVSVSPNVFLLTDEDGDDVADTKEVIYTGIGGEQHDHGIHAFVFGPDGRFYFNAGDAGEQILNKEGEAVIDMAGRPVVNDGNPYRKAMVFRVNPDGSDFEVLGHNFRNIYEVAVDSYGAIWQSDNDDDGNRATRINFVMEYGNYGYHDEMTGEHWRTRRTGMHEEIPKRHWHLNDPGVVPNLLQTGAGSPTGILVYEGDMLPEQFRGQMIHTDAGPNIVRAYPVEDAGAGYTADIINIMKGTYDRWFRPSDVTVAPDGSIFVADWYDPGVGGHHVGDLGKGRIFRIAPQDGSYNVPDIDVSTASGALEALNNPNLSVRYHGWNALHEMGDEAEATLVEQWQGEEPRARARALWLLGRLESGPSYIDKATRDADPNIRMTGIRLARQMKIDVIPILQRMASDSSAQVRREVAIALRHNSSPEAPAIWVELASQYDGNDRWYLEALGIAADGQWDSFFAAWKNQNTENWRSSAARDIVWRSRSPEAIPMLATLIKDPSTTEEDRLRYFRAFDFHSDETAKEAELAGLLDMGNTEVSVLALEHLAPDNIGSSPAINAQLYDVLESVSGTQSYLNLVERFALTDQEETLFAMAVDEGDESLAVPAAGLLVSLNGLDLFMERMQEGSQEEAMATIELLRNTGSGSVNNAMFEIILDTSTSLDLRKHALSQFGPGWRGENWINRQLEAGVFPDDLKDTAASILFSSGDDRRRTVAARYLDPPVGLGGEPLPPVEDMVAMDGSTTNGKVVFDQQCSSCHVVNGQGIDYGPSLSEIGSKLPREALYNAILFPSAGIGFGYEGYELTMSDGSQTRGFILSRTDETIQLREAGGQTNAYVTSDVASINQLDESLMPALGAALTTNQLVDLVAYLESLVSL